MRYRLDHSAASWLSDASDIWIGQAASNSVTVNIPRLRVSEVRRESAVRRFGNSVGGDANERERVSGAPSREDSEPLARAVRTAWRFGKIVGDDASASSVGRAA